MDEICTEIGTSHDSVQSIIRNELQFRKISPRWVPCMFECDQEAKAETKIISG